MLTQNETRIYVINNNTTAVIKKGELGTYLNISQGDDVITIHGDDITELKKIIDEIFVE